MKRGPEPVALRSVALVGVLVVVACTGPAATGTRRLPTIRSRSRMRQWRHRTNRPSPRHLRAHEGNAPRARPRLFHAHELVVRRWEIRSRTREGLCTCCGPPGANAARCDAKGCDTYAAMQASSGCSSTTSPRNRRGAFLGSLAATKLVEVTTLETRALVNHGACTLLLEGGPHPDRPRILHKRRRLVVLARAGRQQQRLPTDLRRLRAQPGEPGLDCSAGRHRPVALRETAQGRVHHLQDAAREQRDHGAGLHRHHR